MFFNRIIRRNTAVGKVAKTCWVRQNQVNREFAFNKTNVNKRITWAPSKSFQTYNLKRYTTNDTQHAIATQERIADAQKRLADAQERIADAQEAEVINGMNIKTSIDNLSNSLGWTLGNVSLNIFLAGIWPVILK